MGIAAADYRQTACQAGGQRAEAVVEHQYPAIGGRRLAGQVLQQVLVGGVEGLQGVVGLLGLADEVEFGERAGQQGHGVGLGTNLLDAGHVELQRRDSTGLCRPLVRWRPYKPSVFIPGALRDTGRTCSMESVMTASADKFTRQTLLDVQPLTPACSR